MGSKALIAALAAVLSVAVAVPALAALDDPIPARIASGGYAVTLVDVATFPNTATAANLAQGKALVNHITHAADGSGRLFVNDSRGPLYVISGGALLPTPFLDLRTLRPGAFDGSAKQGGFRSVAFHPDYAKPGTPGYQRLYTFATETPASASPTSVVFAAPAAARHHNVITEWRVDPSNPNRVDPASRREILRIAQPFPDHSADQIVFDPRAQPGTAGYGKLWITAGDGGNNPPNPDQYRVAQNTLSALGKVLRIDPLRQANGKPYGIPADNPFVGRAGYLPELWALGLRHPAALSFDRGGSGTCVLTDIGQDEIEELNLCRAGANYGWREREGTFTTEPTGEGLNPLPANDATFGYTYPVAQYDEDEGIDGTAAITGGNVYRGTAVPNMVGQYIFGDMVTGKLYHVPVDRLALGSQFPISELTIMVNGQPKSLLSIVGGTRTDLRLGQGQNGEMYVMTKQDGKIRRIAPYGLWTGGSGADVKTGTAYGDTLYGRGGADTLLGVDGPDLLFGEAGADLLTGGRGYDILTGGSQADQFIFNQPVAESPFGAADLVQDFASGTDKIVLKGLGASPRFIGTAAFTAGGGIQVRYKSATQQVQIDANDNGSFGAGDAAIKGPVSVVAADIVFG